MEIVQEGGKAATFNGALRRPGGVAVVPYADRQQREREASGGWPGLVTRDGQEDRGGPQGIRTPPMVRGSVLKVVRAADS